MPIKSYVAHAMSGRKDELFRALNALGKCEAVPAENEDVIALVTDTASENDESELLKEIEALPSLKMLSLVSGYSTSQK